MNVALKQTHKHNTITFADSSLQSLKPLKAAAISVHRAITNFNKKNAGAAAVITALSWTSLTQDMKRVQLPPRHTQFHGQLVEEEQQEAAICQVQGRFGMWGAVETTGLIIPLFGQ